MANRSGSDTQFDRIRQILEDWAQARTNNGQDDYSLAGNTGLQSIRLTDPQKFASILQGYKPDLLKLQPNITSLSQALDLATDPNPRPQMKRAILYITSLPSTTSLAALPNLTDRAAQLGVRVFVWSIGPNAGAKNSAVEALELLATRTGGQFFAYTGKEELPDPEIYFQPLRPVYHIQYTSSINESGSHHVYLKLLRPEMQLSSEEQTVKLEIQPPNPMFMAPPSEIFRTWGQAENSKEAVLQPETTPLDILVEFADGHPRELKSARLYVNGQIAVENKSAPFTHFDWPVGEITTSGKQTIRVEVEDVLGLKSSSIETPIDVEVEAKRTVSWSDLLTPQRLITGGAVLGAGMVLVLALIFAGRQVRRSLRAPAKQRRLKDPVTQPVPIPQEQQPTAPTLPAQNWPRALTIPSAPARLVRLSEAGHPVAGGNISLNRKEITLGSDPHQATCVLDSPSVNRLHARLTQNDRGEFILADAGSIAGSWINYAPVSQRGMRLEHGDLIHIGKVMFRFELNHPTVAKRPQVTPYEGDYDSH
jgi:hypothetical protein